MRQRGFIAAIAAAVLMTGVAIGVAAEDQPQRQGQRLEGRRVLPGLRGLDLSDAQKEQIRNIRQSHRDEVRAITERTRSARRGIDQASHGASVDEAAIRSQSTALAAAITDGAILRAKVNTQIFNVLTAEQQQKLNELRAQKRLKP